MSELSQKQRLDVLSVLVDGNSERAAERITGVTKKTIGRFALRLGTAAGYLHNTMAHDLEPPVLELDEVWSYVRKKQARVTPEEHAAGYGEAYAFIGLAMPARYVVGWNVGKRDQEATDAFAVDLRARVVVTPTLMTSDGFAPYVSAIERTFGRTVDYAQTVKNYTRGGRRDDDHRYEPPRDPFITKKVVFGAPNLDRATTAHIERHNGTMRHFIGRMRRLVYAFSKSPEHHRAAVALCYCYYNLCWIPRTMRITPAMAMGVTKHPWDLAEFLDALLSVGETPAPVVQALAPRRPETTARELPEGRGFLRVVPGSDGPEESPPGQEPPPAAPQAVEPSADATGQLDLLAWRARPVPVAPAAPEREPSKRLPMGQLDLFGLDLDGGEPTDPKLG
jgi:hypothetical protein